MTLDELKTMMALIYSDCLYEGRDGSWSLSSDDAHQATDRLKDEVLRAIAAGAPNAAELAAEVLKIEDEDGPWDFSRWYA